MGEIQLRRDTGEVHFRVLKCSMIKDTKGSCNFCYDEKPSWRSCENFLWLPVWWWWLTNCDGQTCETCYGDITNMPNNSASKTTATRMTTIRIFKAISDKLKLSYTITVKHFFFLLALQPPLGVVFYSPLVGFSLLAYEVSWSHTTTRHSR